MKTLRESFRPDTNSSFRLIRNPMLSDVFYWHFHPELELVYIEGADGTRHVGEHISSFTGKDLVFIGSHIPHLNFDYGVKSEYEKVVLHIQPTFREQILQYAPEFEPLRTVFDLAKYGLAFPEEIRDRVGEKMMGLDLLKPFDQFLEILKIFRLLSESPSYTMLHDSPYINRTSQKAQDRLHEVYHFVSQHFQRKISLEEVASRSNLSKEAFCRYFKAANGNTFFTFLTQYRVSHAKRLLLKGQNVTETCYDCGFESISYFTRTFHKISGETPSAFRKRHMKRWVSREV